MQKILTEKLIAQAQIEAWKKEYKHVYAIEVEQDDNKKITGYFRRPTMDELGLSSQGKETNAFKTGTILYNTCLLGGHPAFNDDDEVKLSAMAHFKEIIKAREATIKKL